MANIPSYLKQSIVEAKNKNLKSLKLSWAKLKDIPQEVFELKHLEELILSYNNINTLASDIRELPNLKRIYLTGNPLQSITDIKGLIVDYQI